MEAAAPRPGEFQRTSSTPAEVDESDGSDECVFDSDDDGDGESDASLDTPLSREISMRIAAHQSRDDGSSMSVLSHAEAHVASTHSEEQSHPRETALPPEANGGKTPLYDDDDDADTLPELLFLLSITLCLEEFSDGRPYSSTLMYMSGVLGFTQDGVGFHRPRLYTPTLSALILSNVIPWCSPSALARSVKAWRFMPSTA